MSDRIEVVGTGTAQVPPDLLVATLEAEVTAPDVAAALAVAEQAARAMMAAAEAPAADLTEVRTIGVSVSTNHGQSGPEGYRAAIGLQLTVRRLEDAGAVLASVVAAGGNASRVQGVTTAVSDSQQALDAAREAAFADARHQAEQLARLAGRELGAVTRVTPEQPLVPFARAASVAGGGRTALSVPVEPGSTALTVSFRVRFHLE